MNCLFNLIYLLASNTPYGDIVPLARAGRSNLSKLRLIPLNDIENKDLGNTFHSLHVRNEKQYKDKLETGINEELML